MSDIEILLILFTGLLIGGILAFLLNKNDRVALFLWLSAGSIPGVDLLVGGPTYFNLLIVLPLMGIAWRRMNMKKRQGQLSGL